MSKFLDLLDYCNSESQTATVQACIDTGSTNKAAKKLGKACGTIGNTLDRIRKNAAKRGWAPDHDMNKPTAPGYAIKGTSTLYDEDGKVKIQWVKTNADAEAQLEQMQDAIEAMKEDIPVYKSIKRTTNSLANSDLLNLITMTDLHIGMYASKNEGGADWNLEIAEEVISNVFKRLIDEAPPAKTCVISFLGDVAHYDSGQHAVTPHSGHVLESAGSLQQIVPVVIRSLRRIVDYALENHEKVVISQVEGNHDFAGTVWIREFFKQFYSECDDVTVMEVNSPFIAYEHGKVMLGWHHGHKMKLDNLPLYFATAYPQIWGNTQHRYIHTGDKHHSQVKDYAGVIVRQHSTIIARDRYASGHGYNSARKAERITYHSEMGECGSGIVTPDMVG
jgi:hypothetical protein